MRKKVDLFDVFQETLDKLDGNGILLVAGDPPNPMTIGWATIGNIWGKQIITMLVRPVRHTFGLMEKTKDFSVCVLPDIFRKEIGICGTKSGRDISKTEFCKFNIESGMATDSFYIAESVIHFECRIVHKHWLNPETLEPAIEKRYYPKKDFHMVYYGEIIGIYRRE